MQAVVYAGEEQKTHGAEVSDVPQAYVTTGFPQVVVVSGTNFDMGAQYGEQATAAIVHNVALFKSRLNDKFGSEKVKKDMEAWGLLSEEIRSRLCRVAAGNSRWMQTQRPCCDLSRFDCPDGLSDGVLGKANAPYPEETRVSSIKGVFTAFVNG